MTERAISTTVGYVITLGVTSLLVTGLLIAGGGFVQDQREQTVRNEMEVIGQQLAADIAAVDRLTGAGGSGTTVRIDRELPDKVTGTSYTVEVDGTPGGESNVELVLTTEDPKVSVEVSVYVQTEVADRQLQGGDVVVELIGGPQIEVSSA